MQDISGTNLATNWAAASATPCFRLRVKWDGTNWTDESNYLLSASLKSRLVGTMRDLSGLGRVPPASMNVMLMNPYVTGEGYRYSPENAAGPLYSYISSGLYRFEVELECGYVDSVAGEQRLVQFTGYIELPTVLDSLRQQVVMFVCSDMAAPLQEQPYYGALLVNQQTDEIIEALLDDVGYTNRDLDSGLSVVPWYWSKGDYVWDELQDVAASEGGWFYFAKDGEARFETMTHWLVGTDHTASGLTLDEDDWTLFQVSTDWRNAYHAIEMEYQVYGVGELDVLYRYAEDFVLAPEETRTLHAEFYRPAYDIVTPVADTDYRAVSAANASMNSVFDITVTDYAGKAVIVIENQSTTQDLYVTGLQLRGWPLVGGPQQMVRLESSLGLVPEDKVLQPSRNLNMQSYVQASLVAHLLRDWLERPRRMYRVNVPCPCWLELGDRITLENEDAGLDEDMYVVGLDQTLDVRSGRYSALLTLLACIDLFPYDSYFTWGVSAYADADSKPLFY